MEPASTLAFGAVGRIESVGPATESRPQPRHGLSVSQLRFFPKNKGGSLGYLQPKGVAGAGKSRGGRGFGSRAQPRAPPALRVRSTSARRGVPARDQGRRWRRDCRSADLGEKPVASRDVAAQSRDRPAERVGSDRRADCPGASRAPAVAVSVSRVPVGALPVCRVRV